MMTKSKITVKILATSTLNTTIIISIIITRLMIVLTVGKYL